MPGEPWATALQDLVLGLAALHDTSGCPMESPYSSWLQLPWHGHRGAPADLLPVSAFCLPTSCSLGSRLSVFGRQRS